jgi:hypothetical protein
MNDNATLFLVHWYPAHGMLEGVDGVLLEDGMMLIRSTATKSQVYHHAKRELSPDRLLVAALQNQPKMKGMVSGSHAWLKAVG